MASINDVAIAADDRPLWTPTLRECLEDDLAAARDGFVCHVTHRNARTPSVAKILAEAMQHLNELNVGRAAEQLAGASDADARARELNEWALLFVADSFEAACAGGLLSAAERRTLPQPGKGYKVVTHPIGRTAAKIGQKRGRAADDGSACGALLEAQLQSRHYMHHCTVEHLLRHIAALPRIVVHYVVLHATVRTASDEVNRRAGGTLRTVAWLWPRVQELLAFIGGHLAEWRTPRDKYVACA